MLKNVPQPEDLPPADRKLVIGDIANEIERLRPFLRLHGYKATTLGDYLRINHYDVQSTLDQWRCDDGDLAEDGQPWADEPTFFAEEGTKLDELVALLPQFRAQYQLFDFGLLEKTLITCVHRPSCPDQVFSVWRMPRNSRQGRCWQLFAQLRRQGRLPRGILPFEDVFEYGKNSILVILCRPTAFKTRSLGEYTPVRGLYKALAAFEALADLHNVGVTINYWPSTNPPTDRLCAEYVYDRNDPSQFKVGHSLGWAEPLDEPAYAEITARPFTRRVDYRIPAFEVPAPYRHSRCDPRLLCEWDSDSAIYSNAAAPIPAFVSASC